MLVIGNLFLRDALARRASAGQHATRDHPRLPVGLVKITLRAYIDVARSRRGTLSLLFSGRFQGIVQEHGDRQRSHAARYGRDAACDRSHICKIDIANDPIRRVVDAHVHNGGTGLDHVMRDKPRPSHGNHKNICHACDLAKISSATVAERHRGVASFTTTRKKDGQGPADDGTAADDHHVGSIRRYAAAKEQLLDAVRRAGNEAGLTLDQVPHVFRMQGIDVLDGTDGLLDPQRMDSIRERELDEDAVDLAVPIEPGDQGQ